MTNNFYNITFSGNPHLKVLLVIVYKYYSIYYNFTIISYSEIDLISMSLKFNLKFALSNQNTKQISNRFDYFTSNIASAIKIHQKYIHNPINANKKIHILSIWPMIQMNNTSRFCA